MSQAITYTEVPAAEVPGSLRWDTPRREQGQTLETSYAQPGARGEAGHGGLWMRVTDHSLPLAEATTYYKRG